MQPTRLMNYLRELKETDSILKDELFSPFSRLINNKTNNKSKRGHLLKMTDQLDQKTMIISTENIRSSTDMRISIKCETVQTENSTGNVPHLRKAEFTRLCSININNDPNKSNESRRENFLNPKSFDSSYLHVTEQRLSRHVKTVKKTDEFDKENRPLNLSCSGSKKENLRLNLPLHRSQKENQQLEPCFNQPQKQNQRPSASSDGSQKENMRFILSPFIRSQKENRQLEPCFNQRPSPPSDGSQKKDMQSILSSFGRSQNENQQLNPSCLTQSQKENIQINSSSLDDSQKENMRPHTSSFDRLQKENQQLDPSRLNQSQKENKRLNLSSRDRCPKDNLRSNSSFNVLQKKNQTLYGSSSYKSQNFDEASRLRDTSIPTASRKQRLLRHPNNITPLDPQVELLIGRIDRHPSIYVTDTGFINILLKQGILLEVTVDKAFRLVDLNQNMAATISGRTKACSVNHSLGVICQSTSSADFALGKIWQAKIRAGHITVGDRCQVAWFDKVGNFGTSEYSKCHFVDTDLIDYTVDLLLFSASYGSTYVPFCKKLVSSAKFESTNIGNITVHLNGVKIIQKSHGDVIVMSGSKLLKMRPRTQSVEIYAGSTKIDVSPEWGVTCHMRNSISLTCSNQQLIMSNGSIESRLKGKGQINLRKVSDKTH